MFTNIAFYKFVHIENPTQLQFNFKKLCGSLKLKGTIIVAHEGLNSCLAGNEADIEQFILHMQTDERFADIEFKKSFSEKMPFRKMLVKLKKETIPMGFEYIKPAQSTGKHIKSLELKEWLDNKEDVVILDTRNAFEVEVGTFRKAVNPNLKKFRDFPNWINAELKKNADWKKKKVVTFCTGGIRCEKATAYMQHLGCENVYQVHGGILQYFEDTHTHAPTQDNHFDGECFVFDYRVAVEKDLNPSENYTVCYKCWNPLQKCDLDRPEYTVKVSCHHCIHK